MPFYIVRWGSQELVIVSSAGHLFGPDTRVEGLPVLKISWAPLWQFDRRSRHLKRFYELLSRVVPKARSFINACDYDIEGSAIGYKIIEAFGDLKRAKRMKFSSLTQSELRESFKRLQPLDVNNAMAGIARAELDWLWGINVSRMLMRAYETAIGKWRSLSAGRVQTPTLAEAVKRWKQINTYVPLPSFSLRAKLTYDSAAIVASPDGWAPATRSEAESIARSVKEEGYMIVKAVSDSEYELRPPPPFNLTDLQEEAARIYGLSPYRTQEIAEDLYLSALISYPRTNSQRLPPSLDYGEILRTLGSNPKYSALVKRLLSETKGRLVPRQGEKDDPAHPAIYPTGERPSRLDRDHERVYDLIVRRFLAVFAASAKMSKRRMSLRDGDGRPWAAEGVTVLREGWLAYYVFSRPEEERLPPVPQGSRLSVAGVTLRTIWPRHGVQLSRLALLRWMESNGLGTKGTRARIIETLYRRGFLEVRGGRTEVTDLGYAVYKVLSSVAPELTSVSLTRSFEEQLEGIERGTAVAESVVSKARSYIGSLVERHVSENFKSLVGALERQLTPGPQGKCKICGRPALSSGLCELHAEALEALRRSLPEVTARLEVSEREAMKEIAKRRVTGRWVREVAEAILSGSLNWPQQK